MNDIDEPRYLMSFINYDSPEAAIAAGHFFSRFVVLERHRDGKASVVYLTNQPVQPGQVPYVGDVET